MPCLWAISLPREVGRSSRYGISLPVELNSRLFFFVSEKLTRRRCCTCRLCRIYLGDGACFRCWPWLAASGTSGKRVNWRESWSRPSLKRYVCTAHTKNNRVGALSPEVTHLVAQKNRHGMGHAFFGFRLLSLFSRHPPCLWLC